MGVVLISQSIVTREADPTSLHCALLSKPVCSATDSPFITLTYWKSIILYGRNVVVEMILHHMFTNVHDMQSDRYSFLLCLPIFSHGYLRTSSLTHIPRPPSYHISDTLALGRHSVTPPGPAKLHAESQACQPWGTRRRHIVSTAVGVG